MSTSPLHLVRLHVDGRALSTFAARHKLLDDDLGYALHLALRRRFGKSGPQPFRRMANGHSTAQSDTITLLAYSRDVEEFEKVFAGTSAGKTDDAALLTRLFPVPPDSRPMPLDWSSVVHLNFEVMVRPVRRHGAKARQARDDRGASSTGSERDAFLAAVENRSDEDPTPDRETVYATWLSERLAGAAEVMGECRMARFRRTRVRRLKHPQGQTRVVEGPEALLTGRLRITDAEAFDTLLGKGVGRHSAFGFGMLLLAPPGD